MAVAGQGPIMHFKRLYQVFCLVKAMVFVVVMYRCESWTVKKAACWRIDAFELWCWRRLLRVPWTARRSNQSLLKEINPEYSLEETDAEAEVPIIWPPDGKSWLIGKDPGAGKHWRQKEMRVAEDEMVGWHQWLNGHEFEQTLGDGEGQGSLVCCSPWTHEELDTTEWLNNWTTKYLVSELRQGEIDLMSFMKSLVCKGSLYEDFHTAELGLQILKFTKFC